jgi:flagellar basal-body rod modification protein FlgD
MSVSSITTTSTNTAAQSYEERTTIDSTEFLQIMMTTIQNQDPLDPKDLGEYTEQLNSYYAVEQQTETNEKLDELIGLFQSYAAIGGAAYLGKTLEIDSASAPVQEGEAAWTYTLGDEASSVALTVTDVDGNVVYSGEGDAGAGLHELSLSSADFSRAVDENETLTLSVEALDAGGGAISSTITAYATPTSAEVAGGDSAYVAGALRFTDDDVVKIHA